MLSTKQKIIKNFDKGASTYTPTADIQRQIAAQLVTKLNSYSPKTILEIGCGTGILSQHLVTLFPEASLLLTDPAPAMLDQCRKNISTHPAPHFSCMDGESLTLTDTYDLIISSMSLHWFTDLQYSFIDIIERLNQGGEFVFSLLGENSFKEWRAICHAAHIPCGIPIFPAPHLLQTMLPFVEIDVKIYEKTYRNPLDFLSSLKKLGAATARSHYNPLSLTQLRRVFRRFNTEITISYEVIYGVYKNKNITRINK